MNHKMRQIDRFHFLHIGKTGGSALKHALAQKEMPQVVLLHNHQVTLADVPPGERVFFFLRNPISRFVSGFLSRQRQGQPRYFSPWSENESLAFSRFGSPNQLAMALASSNSADRNAAIEAMHSIQHVRDSYWRWLGTATSLLSRSDDILFIGLQEHMNSDIIVLADHLNIGKIELPDDDVAAHRNPAHLDRSLSPESVANLTRWYRQEFDAINMCIKIARKQGFGGSLAAAKQ